MLLFGIVLYELLFSITHLVFHKLKISKNHIVKHHYEKGNIPDLLSYAKEFFMDEVIFVSFIAYYFLFPEYRYIGFFSYFLFMYLMHYIVHQNIDVHPILDIFKRYHRRHHESGGACCYDVGLVFPILFEVTGVNLF